MAYNLKISYCFILNRFLVIISYSLLGDFVCYCSLKLNSMKINNLATCSSTLTLLIVKLTCICKASLQGQKVEAEGFKIVLQIDLIQLIQISRLTKLIESARINCALSFKKVRLSSSIRSRVMVVRMAISLVSDKIYYGKPISRHKI